MTTKELVVNRLKSIGYETELDEGPISGMTVMYKMLWELEPSGKSIRMCVNDTHFCIIDAEKETLYDMRRGDWLPHSWLIEVVELENMK